MNRLAATLKLDVLNQYRQGFYVASVIILITIASFAYFLSDAVAPVIPAILLTNMTIATFVFVGGLVLLEKGEGTLESVAISPLRPSEYLLSKIGTLTALAIIENLVITSIAVYSGIPDSVNWGWVWIGSALAGALYTSIGFIVVIRYDSLNEYLIPMMVATILLELPGGVGLGMPEFTWLTVLPTYALLWIFRAAFEPVPAATLIYGILYPTVCLIAAFVWSQKLLQRYASGQLAGATA